MRRAGLITAFLLCVAVLPRSAGATQAGTLDPAFGLDGRVLTSFGPGDDQVNDLAVQADGRIVVAGQSDRGTSGQDNEFALARYLPNGSLDSTFGTNGRARTVFGDDAAATGLALQPDGRIVAVGWSWSDSAQLGGTTTIAIARYLAGGTLDSSFGGDGKVRTKVGRNSWGAAVAVTDDGILAAGRASVHGALVWVVARYDFDGSLDPTFGGDGTITTAFPQNASAGDLAVDQDGTFAIAGTMYVDANGDGVFAVARYLPDGSLDTGFSADGMRTISLGAGLTTANAIVIQPDGRIVVAGGAGKEPAGPTIRFALVRLDPDGSKDASFGANGVVRTFFGPGDDHVSDVVLQPNGRIVAAGWADDHGFALARYASDGSLDPTFGGDGRATSSFDDEWPGATAVGLQPNGKIVAAGRGPGPSGSGDMELVRYLGRFTPTYRPDAFLRWPWGSKVGNDVYGRSGRNQTMTDWRPRAASFHVRFENDGDATDGYLVKGCDATKGFSVRYLTDGVDVTRRVQAGTYRTGPIDPGKRAAMSLQVLAARSVPFRTRFPCRIVARSAAQRSKLDAVRAVFVRVEPGCLTAVAPSDGVRSLRCNP